MLKTPERRGEDFAQMFIFASKRVIPRSAYWSYRSLALIY